MENFNFEVLDSDQIDINGTVIDLHTVPQNRLDTMQARYSKKAGSDADWESGGYYAAALEAIERVQAHRVEFPEVTKDPEDLLAIAKAKQVDETVICPQCKTPFVKTQSQQTFCSNGRGDSHGNCKDRYWNLHSPTRKQRLDNIHENYV
jgi:hypothetical protein